MLTICGSHSASCWLQFCTHFSDLFFDLIFQRFPKISGSVNPRKPCVYCSKTMIYAKPPSLNNLRKTLISDDILTFFVGALWLQISTLIYIDFRCLFKLYFFDFCAKRLPKLGSESRTFWAIWPPRALPDSFQNASAAPARFLIDFT